MKRKIIAEASENERMRMKIYVLFMDSNLASIIIFDFFHLPFFAFFPFSLLRWSRSDWKSLIPALPMTSTMKVREGKNLVW